MPRPMPAARGRTAQRCAQLPLLPPTIGHKCAAWAVTGPDWLVSGIHRCTNAAYLRPYHIRYLYLGPGGCDDSSTHKSVCHASGVSHLAARITGFQCPLHASLSAFWGLERGILLPQDRRASESTKRVTGHDSAWEQESQCGLRAWVILPRVPQSRPVHLTAFVDLDVNQPLVRRQGSTRLAIFYLLLYLSAESYIQYSRLGLRHSNSSMRA